MISTPTHFPILLVFFSAHSRFLLIQHLHLSQAILLSPDLSPHLVLLREGLDAGW